MPVDLPTEYDIVPFDPVYTRGDRERDLEAGEGMMMQEIDHKPEVVTVSRTPPSRTSPLLTNSEFTEDTVFVPLSDQGESSSSPRSSVEHVRDVDLLSEEGVVLRTSIPTNESPEHERSSSGSSAEDLTKDSESEEEAPPDTTIRLVGGGGTQGQTTQEVEPEVEDDDDLVEIPPLKSATSIDSKKAKHKKEKSSITKVLGGKRKKVSVSSTPPVVT